MSHLAVRFQIRLMFILLTEGDSIGTELVEEGRDEVHGLELVDTLGAGVVSEVECWNGEADKASEETNDLHPLAAVEFVVDQERGEIVADEFDTDVDQVPEPVCGDVS
jgi:hypothetical protein